ncbi:GNAT family N-acetyltransferase [Amycolatopsis sp. NBC_01480]|uniref:GNAT family N-acetyltransferase n=1 Tax=Amycolatopsis sp. NBC_01480 TaxID=2903562 RepID=UPI002E2A6201|nr:GNAT family N-acetyltransferase [Amycolatopsis sp. NBC_01480]
MSELGTVGTAPDPGYPFRAPGPHARCLNGHSLDLAGQTLPYYHVLDLDATLCNLCIELRLDRPGWFPLDHTAVRRVDVPRKYHRPIVELVAHPPDQPAGVGYIALQISERSVADIDVQMCGIDRRGVIEQIRVDDTYRRRRIGTLLVAAVLARGPGFQWSTTKVDNSVSARAFWASQQSARSLSLGRPDYCPHMKIVNGEGL